MRRSRVVASACAGALLAASLTVPASADLTKRQKAETAFQDAVKVCSQDFVIPNLLGICEIVLEIRDKITGG